MLTQRSASKEWIAPHPLPLQKLSFKRMDCTPPTASSKAVSISLNTGPGPQVASLSCPFLQPWVLTAQASAHSHLPRHPPDHVTSASEIPIISTLQQPLVMFHPPRHLHDHMTCTSAVPMTITLEQQAGVTQGGTDDSAAYSTSMLDIHRINTPHQQAPLTRGCKDDSPAYSNSMLDIYRVVTACGQPNVRGAHLPLPSNFDFHEWSAIAHTQADEEVLQYLKYGFPLVLKVPSPHHPLETILQVPTILEMSKCT